MKNSIRNLSLPKLSTLDRRLLLMPALLYLLIFLVIPVGYLFLLSFYQYDPSALYREVFTLENYVRFLTDGFYREFIYYTLRIALIVTGLCLLFGYPVAHFMSRTSGIMRYLLLFSMVLPLMVGVVVRTYGWMVIFGTNGIINQMVMLVRDEPIQILGTTNAVIIGLVGVLFPFLVLPIYSSLQKVDQELELAARDLGANKFQAFYKVTFPLSLPGVITGSIFCFTLSMSSVITPIILGGRQDMTIGALIYDVALTDLNWPFASAMAAILTGMMFLMLYMYLKLSSSYLEEVQ